jgi:hypothetical protein
MKSNIEELNYRFIKELLNDKVYKIHSEKLNYYYALLKGEISDFKYDVWCKGLFKKDRKHELLGHLESCTEGVFDADIDDWNEEYCRGDIMVDIINIKTLKDSLVSLWMSFHDSDFEHTLINLSPQSSVPDGLSVIKNKNLSKLEVLHVVKEWYSINGQREIEYVLKEIEKEDKINSDKFDEMIAVLNSKK